MCASKSRLAFIKQRYYKRRRYWNPFPINVLCKIGNRGWSGERDWKYNSPGSNASGGRLNFTKHAKLLTGIGVSYIDCPCNFTASALVGKLIIFLSPSKIVKWSATSHMVWIKKQREKKPKIWQPFQLKKICIDFIVRPT